MSGALVCGACLALAVLCWPLGASVEGSTGREAAGTTSRWRVRRAWVRDGSARDGATAEVLSVLDGLAAALRAGLPTAEALAAVAESLPEPSRRALLTPVLTAAREGRSGGAVWRRLARSRGDPELAGLARAWALGERLGVPMADAVSTAAVVGRARVEHRRKVAVATAGARATATLLTGLPVAGLGLAGILGIGPTQLYASPIALLSLLAGGVLVSVGRWTVGRMVGRVEGGPR